MTPKNQLGKLGEDLACGYLVDKGYKIIERNFRKPWGELDIIAKSPDKTLVFVEVKTMRKFGNEFGNQSGNDFERGVELSPYGRSAVGRPDSGIEPEMQMTAAKIKKTKRAASLYAGAFPEKIDEKAGWRIDLVALTINEKDCLINHYENI